MRYCSPTSRELTSILRMEECVYGDADERFDPENIIQRDRYGGGSVMVWGGISHRGKSELVVVNGTLKNSKILRRNCRSCSSLLVAPR